MDRLPCCRDGESANLDGRHIVLTWVMRWTAKGECLLFTIAPEFHKLETIGSSKMFTYNVLSCENQPSGRVDLALGVREAPWPRPTPWRGSCATMHGG